jgi:hypothetical protein
MTKDRSSEPIGIKPIPHMIVLVMCWLFVALWSVWILPDTVFIRHTAMIGGAVLTCYVIKENWRVLFQIRSLSFWLIVLLLLWVTIHLFFIGYDFDAQLNEYQQIWKKIALSSLFAAGLGIAIASQGNNPVRIASYWEIIYFALLMPILIYYGKWLATHYLPMAGMAIPKYLYLVGDHISNPMGISRAVYVFEFVPLMALAVGLIIRNIATNNFLFKTNWVYLLTILLVCGVIFLENDRWGTLFIAIILVIGSVRLAFIYSQARLLNFFVIGAIFLAGFYLAYQTVNKNHQWKTLLADAEIALQINKYDYWKDTRKGYPNNSMGAPISDSNYIRIAIPLVGLYLLSNNPLGYGKLSDSMMHLSKLQWSDSHINWTHSGFLDFALGYGIIGFLLLIAIIGIGIFFSNPISSTFSLLGLWFLIAQSSIFWIKEVSMEVPLSQLIFISIFASLISFRSNFKVDNN